MEPKLRELKELFPNGIVIRGNNYFEIIPIYAENGNKIYEVESRMDIKLSDGSIINGVYFSE